MCLDCTRGCWDDGSDFLAIRGRRGRKVVRGIVLVICLSPLGGASLLSFPWILGDSKSINHPGSKDER
jgi:hypothetical protein